MPPPQTSDLLALAHRLLAQLQDSSPPAAAARNTNLSVHILGIIARLEQQQQQQQQEEEEEHTERHVKLPLSPSPSPSPSNPSLASEIEAEEEEEDNIQYRPHQPTLPPHRAGHQTRHRRVPQPPIHHPRHARRSLLLAPFRPFHRIVTSTPARLGMLAAGVLLAFQQYHSLVQLYEMNLWNAEERGRWQCLVDHELLPVGAKVPSFVNQRSRAGEYPGYGG